ncbi:MAG: cell division protein FtsQ/DivIB [Rhodobacter sp.]|nr:cell division protein FtsQ/DivIB [Rhodobacter sp.]
MQPMTNGSNRRDPAPSRWSYRIQRLWLTPTFRQLMRVGLPMASAFFFAAWFLNDPGTREAISEKVAEIRRSVAERPEFMVKLMAVDGASAELAEDIREVLPVDFPLSSFDLDLDQMKLVVEDLDAVATVDLRIRPGGVLHLQVVERLPAVVWRVDGMLELLDETGRRVAPLAARGQRADLPLIVGEGADDAVPEALSLLSAAAPLEDRLRGLVRMGERRWDVVLDRNQRIMLPETGAVEALEQMIALDQAQEMLARDLASVDMRNVQRPTLRMAPHAVTELRRIKALELGEPLQ